MKIYDAQKIEIADVPVTKNAKHEQELMKSDYIRLEWSQEEYMPLPVGAYIEHEGVKYSLFGQYVPDNNGGVYQFKPEFQHPMMLLAHTPCLLTTRDSVGKEIKQTDWTYTGILSTILGRLQGIIYDQLGIMLTFKTKFKPTTDVEESATCTFSGVDIISAFSEVCNQFGGIEYHIDWEGKTVWFGDIFLGDEVSLEEGGNVGMASKSMNSKDYANYFIVRGGTRNITNKTASGDNVQSDSRLSIDDIDKRASTEQPKVQKILTFDYIYPQLDLYVYNVRKRVRRLKDEDKQYIVKKYNADGTVAEYQTYAVYYMRLAYKEGEAWKDYIINNPSEDIVAGKKLTASFEPNEKGTHSQLAGREYELIYHKSDKTIIANPTIGDSGVNILAGDYEIVFEQDGDLIIPNIDTLQPWGNSTPDDTCDKVVLYNIVMSDEYITNAKVRLAEEAEKEIARQYIDKTNYTVNSNPIEFAERNPGLSIGRAVRYRTLSGEVMSTRINRLVTQLDYPIEQEITLGNAVIKGNTQQLKEDVKSISVAIDVNESSATRINSMLNSMMRELMEYDAHLLHRDRDDETAYKLTVGELLVKGIAKVITDMSIGGKLSTNGIENDGNNITKGLTYSKNFKNSMTAGSGWQIDEKGNAQVESMEVRSYMRVLELVMNRLSAEESEFIFTESGTVETATLNEEDGSYTLTMRKKTDKDITPFQKGDILKGVMNDLTKDGAVGVNYYTSWMLVTEEPKGNSITVAVYADDETPAKKNFPPCKLMVLHRWGNADETKKERQSCWYISSIEKRIVMLDGVTKPKLEDTNYASFYGLRFDMESFMGYSLKANQPYLYVRGALLQDVCFIDYKGQIVKQERYRGIWSQDVANGKDPYIVTQTTFDTVYHKNAKWQCNSTEGTKEEPSVGTTDWTKLSEGGKGSDGKTTYVHIKYSNDGGKTFTDPNGDTVGEWIGVCTDFYKDAPTSVSAYTWSKIKGDNGKNGVNAPRVLYFNSDTRPATPTSKNPSGWGSIPLRPVAVSNMRAEKTSRADYSFGKIENAVHKEYWASLNKGIYNSIAEALIYFDADSDGTVRFDWYVACGSANKASIYKVNSQVDTVIWNVNGYKTGVYDATVKKGTNFIRVCYEKGEKNTDEDRLFIRVLDTSTSRRIWVVTEILTSDGEYAGWSDPVQWTGNDGRNLTKVTNYYKWGTSGVIVPPEPYDPDTIPTHVDGSDYLWNYEVCSDDNGTTISQSGKTCIGYFPKDGKPGSAGKGIKSITEFYQVGTEKMPTKGITVNSDNKLDTTGWKTTMDPTTNENRFVWNQEVIQFTDGTYSISVIHLAGAQGDQGIKGDKGEDAKRIYLESELPFIAMANNGIPKDARYNFSVYARLEHLTGTVTWEVVFKQGTTEITDIPYGEEDTYRYNGNEFIIEDSEVIVSMYGVDTIIITATFGTYKAQITIPVIYDGDPGANGKDGKNGKPLVGPTEWKAGVRYLAGKSNEAYQSLVINPKYPKQMYLCGYSHSGKEPLAETSASSVDTCTKDKPWVQVPYQDFVATKVLFAERGKVENLDITNATIQGTITDIAVSTEKDWDAITNALAPKEDKGYVESKRNFQIVDPSKAGSYFIPTFYPTGRESNSLIVFLPTYNPSTDYDIITCNTTLSNVKKRYNIPKYQIAGTHIRITKGGAPLEYSRWAYLEDAEYDRLWTSNNTINRQTIRDIYNMGTLICADHKIFKVTDGNGKHGHNITGAWYYGDSDYKHGRLSVNGAVARMLWLMPGQTVELVSQIEEINNTKCLVWSVVNASDFTAVNINADVDRKRKTYNENFSDLYPVEFHGESGILAPDLAGNADNWEDCFIAHKKIDNLLLNGETKRIPSLFINRNDPTKEDDYPIAEFYIP